MLLCLFRCQLCHCNTVVCCRLWTSFANELNAQRRLVGSLSAWGGGLERGAEGAEKETPKASIGVGNGEEYPPPQRTSEYGERRKLPAGREENGFTAF